MSSRSDDPRPTWGGADATWSVDVEPEPEERPHEDRYELRREIGRGGMGLVWLAWDRELGRDVAYKEIDPGKAGRGAGRFLREARLTARLEHPNIVPVYDAGRTPEGKLFYVMRMLNGRSMSAAIKECRTLADRLALLDALIAVCEAIAHAHARGVLHRDLKPHNVMLAEHGQVTVVDWGLAKVLAEGRAIGADLREETQQGAIVGTPAYMSPEQATGQPVTRTTDVWALGAMLYELLTGRPPFHGTDVWSVVEAVARQPVPEIDVKATGAPPELVAIAQRALQRDASLRYPDAGGVVADLQAFRRGRKVSAYVYSPMEELGRLVRLYRVPLAGLGLGLAVAGAALTVAFGWVWTERTAAVNAERAAIASRERMALALQDALVEKARAAAGDDEPGATLAYAAAVLGIGDAARGSRPTTLALGQIARFAGTSTLVADGLAARGAGPCTSFTRGDGWFWCAGPDAVWGGPASGPAWTRPEGGRALAWDGGARVALSVLDGVRVLDARTGDELARFTSERATRSAFSPDGRRLAWAAGQQIHVADLETGAARALGVTGAIWGGVAWLDDHRLRGWYAYGGLADLDPETGARTQLPLDARYSAWSGALDATGLWLAKVSLEGKLSVVDVANGTTRLLREHGRVGQLGWSGPDRVWLSDEDQLSVWDVRRGAVIGHLPQVDGARGVVLEGDTLYVPSASGVRRMRLAPEARPTRYDLGAGVSDCLPDGPGILWCALGNGEMARVDLAQPTPTERLLVSKYGLRSMARVDAGIVIANGDEPILFAPDRTSHQIPGERLPHVVPHPSDPHVAWVSGDTVHLRDAAWAEVKLPQPGPVREVLPTDEGWLAVGEARAWRLSRDGAPLGTFERALSEAFWSGGSRIAERDDRTIRLWRLDGSPAGSWTAPERILSVKLMSERAVVVAGSQLYVIDLPTGPDAEATVLAVLEAHETRASTLVPLEWRGRDYLFTAGYGGEAYLWDLSVLDTPTPALQARLRAETGLDVEDAHLVLAAPE